MIHPANLLYLPPPPPKPGFLPLSGNEITDATRRAATQGDGVSPPDFSTGVWEATTNVETNGGFESNTTGWSGQVGAVISRVATAKFGAIGLDIQCDGTTNGLAQESLTIVDSTAYTYSVWCSRTEVDDDWKIDSTGDLVISAIAIPKTLGYQRVSGTATSTGTSTTLRVINTTTNAATNIVIDGVQLEAQPIATPYVETDGGTASRTAARVQMPVAGVVSEKQGWYAVRWRAGASFSSGDYRLVSWRDGDGDALELYLKGATSLSMVELVGFSGTDEGTSITVTKGVTYTGIGSWDRTHYRVSLDGEAFPAPTARPGTQASITTTSLDIGTLSPGGTGQHPDADFLWFVIGKGTLTDQDAAHIDFLLSNNKTGLVPSDFPGDCTAVWDGTTGVFLKAG
jgi:hypothetical protein